MPEWDLNLKRQGLLPLLPEVVEEAAFSRRPGYKEAVWAASILSKNVLYISPTEYKRISVEFRLDTPPGIFRDIPEVSKIDLPKEIAPVPANPKDSPDSVAFFGTVLPEDHRLKFLQKSYHAEVAKAQSANCTKCQLNGIKRKYKLLINNE
jgi:hypothetical protein